MDNLKILETFQVTSFSFQDTLQREAVLWNLFRDHFVDVQKKSQSLKMGQIQLPIAITDQHICKRVDFSHSEYSSQGLHLKKVAGSHLSGALYELHNNNFNYFCFQKRNVL